MEALIKEWTATWSTTSHGQTHGPMFIYERDKQYMTPEQVQAWAEEQEAMHNLINKIAESIAEAFRQNKDGGIIEELNTTFELSAPQARDFYRKYLLPRIFARTLAFLRAGWPEKRLIETLEETAAELGQAMEEPQDEASKS